MVYLALSSPHYQKINAVDNFYRRLRGATKTKEAFVSDDALIKRLYLATILVTETWAQPVRNRVSFYIIL